MKGAVLALFCAIALVSAELNENGCPINPYVDILKPHPNCNKFYQCVQGELIERRCATLDLMFNEETQECDWASNVDCGNRPVVPESSEEENSSSADSSASGESNESGNNGNGNSSEDNSSSNESNDNNNGGNGNPGEAAEICAAEGSNGVLVAHENCNQFYKCSYGKPVALNCPPNLKYNVETEQCDWPENVNCDGRNEDNGNGGNGDGDNEDSGNGDGDNEDSGNGDGDNESGNGDSGNGDGGNGDGDNEDSDNGNNGGGNGNPSEAPEICAAEGSEGVLVAHENCNQFYKCANGVPVALDCNLNLLYNYATEQCDWPENVNCEGRNQGGNDGNGDDNNVEEGGNGGEDNGDGNDSNDNNNVGDGNGNPSEAPEICAAEDSDGVLVAHENCNQFYKCANGVPVALDCNPNLLYNYATEQCDWAENVNCEGRNQGGNDGNDSNGDDSKVESGSNESSDSSSEEKGQSGGGNNNPSDAPEICAAEGSDSVLVAHENCNQYYICQDGLPVTRDCNPNLVFNPAEDKCDWPENVDCGNRRTFSSRNKHLRFGA